MSPKADSLCATINLQRLGKQHMNSPDMNFCFSPEQTGPPLSMGNLGMAVSTKLQQAKATAPTCNHLCCVMASTLPEFAPCQQELFLMGLERSGTVPTRHNVEASLCERDVSCATCIQGQQMASSLFY